MPGLLSNLFGAVRDPLFWRDAGKNAIGMAGADPEATVKLGGSLLSGDFAGAGRQAYDNALDTSLRINRGLLSADPAVKAETGMGFLGIAKHWNTPEFKQWFGDSKVVDGDGNPMRVYHGTTGNVEAFDPVKRGSSTKTKSAEKGFYFTSSPRHASVYADGVTNTMRGQTRDGANVVPAYVQMTNPKVIVTRRPVEMEVDTDDGKTVQDAIDAGHDGIIVSREVGDEYDAKLVIPFRPQQIKSAIGNDGRYDIRNGLLAQ